MKKILTLICTLLCANVLMAQTRFWIDSLQYEVTSINPAEVEVYDANSSITTANIPETVTYQGTDYSVTSIGIQAFFNCTSLTSVTIPNSVTSIGIQAFEICTSLPSVTIPESVNFIGGWAFVDCSNLTILNFNAVNCGDIFNYEELGHSGSPFYGSPINTIILGENVQRIPAEFASSLYSLTSVTLGNSVTSIGEDAFYNCSSLASVTIPNRVTSIGNDAFQSCSSLTSIDIPNSVTSIGDYAFQGCSSLTSVTFSNSVTSIGNFAFGDCSSLTSIDIPNSVTSIGDYAFCNCSSLTSVTIPNSVTSIGDMAFYSCSSLTSVNIPNSVTSIGNGAFRGCSSLTSVTIPNSVTSIGEEAFQSCSSLTSVTIGNSVTSIGEGAFTDCSFLQNVTCLATTPPTLADNTVFPYPNIATLTVPCGTLEAYSAPTSFWNMFFMGRIEEDCEDNSGLEDAEETLLSFFPNPTKSKITFSQEIEKVEIIDLTGKTIFTFSNAREINIESLPAGAYYLRLTNDEKTSLQKVIKQ